MIKPRRSPFSDRETAEAMKIVLPSIQHGLWVTSDLQMSNRRSARNLGKRRSCRLDDDHDLLEWVEKASAVWAVAPLIVQEETVAPGLEHALLQHEEASFLLGWCQLSTGFDSMILRQTWKIGCQSAVMLGRHLI